VGSLHLSNDDTVIEIGPGLGALTRSLIELAGKVVAIEFDRDMVAVLHERFGKAGNFELVNADALSVDFAKLVKAGDKKIKLVANLPYNISTTDSPTPDRAASDVFGDRSNVSTRGCGAYYGSGRGQRPWILERFGRRRFCLRIPFRCLSKSFPTDPKGLSAVVRLTPKPQSQIDHSVFRKVVSSSFAQKRKTIFNNLKSTIEGTAAVLSTAGIDAKRRAETLTLEEWKALTRRNNRIE